MFDIGFSELLVIAVVALLVLGPERLPKAARYAGLWVRKARGHWYSVKAEFERDLAADDLQRSLRETREALSAAEEQLRSGASDLRNRIERDFTETAAAVTAMPDATASPEAEGVEAGEATVTTEPQPQADDHEEHSLGSTREGLYEPEPPTDEDEEGVLHTEDAPPPSDPRDDAHERR